MKGSVAGLVELEGARIALLSQFSYSQLSSAATKSVLLGFDLRLGIYLSYAHAKGKGSPKRGRRINSSAVVKGPSSLLDSSLAAVSYLVKESKSSVSSEPSLLAIIAKDRSLSLIFKALSFIRLQAITLFRALASNPDIRSIDICRAGKKAVWSRNPVTEGFRYSIVAIQFGYDMYLPVRSISKGLFSFGLEPPPFSNNKSSYMRLANRLKLVRKDRRHRLLACRADLITRRLGATCPRSYGSVHPRITAAFSFRSDLFFSSSSHFAHALGALGLTTSKRNRTSESSLKTRIHLMSPPFV
ncbi:hypothetical protein VNO77_46296 [Canavalia gladiata]|uniref:Uncharacterized protein n=1 Tax=Canavalia gladiata TaxID=3824 RepID=A0AAN9JES1_CANGL